MSLTSQGIYNRCSIWAKTMNKPLSIAVKKGLGIVFCSFLLAVSNMKQHDMSVTLLAPAVSG